MANSVPTPQRALHSVTCCWLLCQCLEVRPQPQPRFYGPQNLLEQLSRLNLTLNAHQLHHFRLKCILILLWHEVSAGECQWVTATKGRSYSVPGYAVLQDDWISRHIKGWYGRESDTWRIWMSLFFCVFTRPSEQLAAAS